MLDIYATDDFAALAGLPPMGPDPFALLAPLLQEMLAEAEAEDDEAPPRPAPAIALKDL